jgi:hypothetical protein
MSSTGPSIRSVCRILNQSSCGSGSICGIRNGKSLILSNAHVCGTKIGRRVIVEVESTGDRINARVIMAAYSDRTWTDWAVLETEDEYSKVQPVYLSKNRPTGSHYTKGFPRCQAFPGSDIRTVSLSSNDARWTWQPNAIGGQSGSGVWSDTDHLQYGLLTWSIGRDGAGQMTSEIYRQARNFTLAGAPRVDGMVELRDDYNFDGLTRGEDDPYVEPGLFAQRDITDLPIWYEPSVPNPDDPTDPQEPQPGTSTELAIAELRKQIEFAEDRIRILQNEKPPADNGQPDDDNDDCLTYGL